MVLFYFFCSWSEVKSRVESFFAREFLTFNRFSIPRGRPKWVWILMKTHFECWFCHFKNWNPLFKPQTNFINWSCHFQLSRWFHDKTKRISQIPQVRFRWEKKFNFTQTNASEWPSFSFCATFFISLTTWLTKLRFEVKRGFEPKIT